ncbi:spermidine synthase [Dongia sedimenti]|uniref:Fused MFS/spermidine synthase n=1 Tax=Dongia sedimenti TaxID=3064282 RepID=A0ABU0YN26_9PROT|nr:fused MFS/spermidine synthase [Rhodospirillaceae bacterium R-7]
MKTTARTSRSTWLFAGTMLLSAWLVFLIQPMLGRMILPRLGGAASVWITVSLFFQIALLAGYFYAHVISARLRPRAQMAVHAALAIAALMLLPVVVPESWVPPAERPPQGDLILMMAMTVGLPFVVVAATAPLLQRWYSLTGARDAGDPYFLYAASNLGSLAALILYPLLVEPELGLKNQSWFWAATYIALLAGLIACGWTTLRQSGTAVPRADPAIDAQPAPDWKRRLHWLALAAAPSSLFLGVTLQISTDIASVPLLWILPLMVYLLTFVIAFARKPLLTRNAVVRTIPYAATIAVLTAGFETSIGLPQIAVGIALLFLLALSCHSDLVALRPAPRHLTEFFLLMSLGGALGGLFNAVLAPLIFPGVYEYPIAILAAIALWAIGRGTDTKAWLNWKWVAAAVVLFLVLRFALAIASGHGALQWMVAVKAAAALICFAARRKPAAMALLAAAILAAGSDISLRPELARYRSFFGVHRIEADPTGYKVHFLMHGNTTHGAQSMDPERRREPLLYYARSGPAGQAIEALRGAGRLSPVGVIGLGAGAMACLSSAGESWTFFEIDPAILATARDPRYFTFLNDCAPDAKVVLGDGRLKLAAQPDASYRLLVLDAFGSDSIPVHLLTREAVDLYLRKLQPGGLLLLHLSNRNIELLPAVARLATDRGLVGRWQFFPGEPPEGSLISPSEWAVLARGEPDLGTLAADPRWQKLPPLTEARVWSDDYVDILSVIRWPWK